MPGMFCLMPGWCSEGERAGVFQRPAFQLLVHCFIATALFSLSCIVFTEMIISADNRQGVKQILLKRPAGWPGLMARLSGFHLP